MTGSLLLDVQHLLTAIALISPRAVVCLSILPAFGARTVTGIMRTAIALAVALPALPPTYDHVRDAPPDLLLSTALCFKEAAFGLMLGVLTSIPFWVAQSIGSILDMQRMPIQIQSGNASLDPDASALGGVLLQALAVLMMQAGLFVALARLLIESYGLWPASSLFPPLEHGQFDVLVRKSAEFFWHVAVYGGPILIPLLLVDFGFALLGVFMPNFQVSFASSPIKSLGGLFIAIVYWPIFSHYVLGDFSGLLDLGASLLQASPRR